MRVVVLAGGRSSEHDVSRASARAVSEGLAAGGHEVLVVEISRTGEWSHDGEPLSLVPARGLLGADVAFPVLHGPYGEDGVIQGVLECLDIPYVGAGVTASAVCIDKVLFKDLMGAAGLAQVGYRAVRDDQWRHSRDARLAELESLGLPVFVKPARLGSSVGIVKVSVAEELGAALDQAFEHDPLVIVEAMARGIEVECSVLEGDPVRTSLPGEIVIEGEWYDFAAKYEPGGMELVVPARISESAGARLRELAVAAFTQAGCSGLARADFFVERESVVLNELNTMPGFTQTSVYAELWAASGLSYPELLSELCRLGCSRHQRERSYAF